MKYKSGDYEAVHSSPVWRKRANFIFAAHLGMKNDKNEWEQLWGEMRSDGKLELCCIPFFVRNLSLGDIVEIDEDIIFRRVVKRSDQITFRIWFRNITRDKRDEVVQKLEDMSAILEWSSPNLLAVSASRSNSMRIADCLHLYERNEWIQYETGHD